MQYNNLLWTFTTSMICAYKFNICSLLSIPIRANLRLANLAVEFVYGKGVVSEARVCDLFCNMYYLYTKNIVVASMTIAYATII